MTELPISPLARRIAEENNVDWRALEGSDAGGGVNERDVLNYLEGVMLGTQPVDPTPEPLPEGMTAWAEEPGHAQAPQILAAQTMTATTAEADTGITAAETLTPDTSAEATTPPEDAADDSRRVLEELAAAYREALAETEALRLAAQGSEADYKEYADAQAAAQAAAQSEAAQARETLAQQNAELAGLRTRLKELGAREQESRLELGRLRETVNVQDEELVEVHALKRQTEGLKEQLAAAQEQATRLQEENRRLTEKLSRADEEVKKAQGEAERLRSSRAGLEQTVAELKKRPWWKLWG